MKSILPFIFLCFCFSILKAQKLDFEVKIVSKKYQNIKGKLQKVNVEGIGIIDYNGYYFIFKPTEIVRIKVRKRGLTIGKAVGTGTLTGLAIGASIFSLDEENQSFEDMAKLTGLLTASGALIGTVVGVVSEVNNTKLILGIDGDVEKFKKVYQKLEKYVNIVNTQRVN